MYVKQFPTEMFLISIWRAGDTWAGYGARALPCRDGTYIIVEPCRSVGPSDAEHHVLAELQPLAQLRGYAPSEVVIERH